MSEEYHNNKYDVVFLLSGGIGNVLEALYAVEHCLKNTAKVGIYLENVNHGFVEYVRECYGNVLLSTPEKISTKYLIHSFTFQGRVEVAYDYYFYIQPDFTSSAYLSETEQYLSVVHAFFPSRHESTVLEKLKGCNSSRLNELKIQEKIVLYPGCSSNKAASRWPYYIELMKRIGEERVIFIGGNDDIDFRYSYIYPKAFAKLFPQKVLNNRQMWNVFKGLKLLKPHAHYEGIEKRKNAYFNCFSWSELVETFKRCKFFIGNDGGLTHLAAAAGAKGVAIFGPTSVEKNRPYNRQMKVITDGLKCQPCSFGVNGVNMTKYYINCPYQLKCINDIRVTDLLPYIAQE